MLKKGQEKERLTVSAAHSGKKDVICCKKCAKDGEQGEKSPKTTSVDRRKSMRNHCKVVSRAKHNPRALGSTFVRRLAAPETADTQKFCNFDSFWTL